MILKQHSIPMQITIKILLPKKLWKLSLNNLKILKKLLKNAMNPTKEKYLIPQSKNVKEIFILHQLKRKKQSHLLCKIKMPVVVAQE